MIFNEDLTVVHKKRDTFISSITLVNIDPFSSFLADRTMGRAFGTLCHLSVGLRALLSSKRPLLSLYVSVCLFVCRRPVSSPIHPLPVD